MSEKTEFLNKPQCALLSYLSQSLFGTKSEKAELSYDEWAELIYEADIQAVLPSVMSVIDRKQVPEDLLKKADARKTRFIAQNIRIKWEHYHMGALLAENNIPYTVLKGVASSRYYPKPELRVLGDVDFLIDKTDVDKVGKVLINDGFSVFQDEHICHISYDKNGVMYEAHFAVTGVPDGEKGKRIEKLLNGCIEKSDECASDYGVVFVPSNIYHGLIMLLHLAHHLSGEGIGLRHLCDWAVFVNSLDGAESESIFEENIKAAGLYNFAKTLTAVCTDYLGMRKIAWADGVEREIKEKLICDILSSGNFGKKDADRIDAAYLISSRGKHKTSENIVLQFFISVNEAVKVHYPPCAKHKVLLPVGWIAVGSRQAAKIITGKRHKPDFKRMADIASERKKMCSDLKLFEE